MISHNQNMKIWNTNNCTIYQVLEGRGNSFLVNQENNYILIGTGHRKSWRELTTKLDGL